MLMLNTNSCSKPDSPLNGEWMEVRRASPDDKSTLTPEICIQFKEGQRINVKSYLEKGLSATSGYLLEDSILTLTNVQDRILYSVLPETRFLLQRYDDDFLVLKAFIADSNIPRLVYTFIPIEKYNSMDKAQIKNQYSFTKQDSLNEKENWKNWEKEKEQKSKNRYIPFYTGGKDAIDQFILESLRYPDDHVGIKMIIVDFTVTKEGLITNLTTDIKEDNFYTKEAKRVVKSMNKWNPAIVDGETQDAAENLLIIFKDLNKDE